MLFLLAAEDFDNATIGTDNPLRCCLRTSVGRFLPGILNWALDGYERLKERGHFIQPANATETIEAMEMLGAPIKAFIRDKCEVGPTYEADVGELYIEYCKWCEQEGLKPTSKQWFGRDLNTAVPGLIVFKPGTDERKLKYRGIRSLM